MKPPPWPFSCKAINRKGVRSYAYKFLRYISNELLLFVVVVVVAVVIVVVVVVVVERDGKK